MVNADDAKIYDFECIQGRIFVSTKKIFVFKYSQTMFHLVLCEIDMEKVLQKFFWAPIPFKRYQNTFGYGTSRAQKS